MGCNKPDTRHQLRIITQSFYRKLSLMQQTQRTTGGKHRKQASPVKGRVAVVALATGAVSSAGATGASLAHATHDNSTVKINLASDSTTQTNNDSPQVLSIAEFKPAASDLNQQLSKAIHYSQVVAEKDLEARTPKISVHTPAKGTLTSPFGMRWGTLHSGVDIANAMNTPIYSVMDGVVIDSGPASGYGQWIRVRHEDGTITVYGHMETLNVAVGETVTAGQQIAGMGTRGFSTGVHLHFEVHPGGGDAVDPQSWLAEHGIFI
ncbi:M23 family metallopeptidase [Corynebacterium diphtheriae bv. gravis]|nr:M23 family metallopeptidase [Corynebacterium diphtheriae]MBG9368474.1 M23 family metallopeptidase [Corynebacterium diphtheriae bv. gravis]UWE69732.1 M23 family metallopeptidase [Corynebacterium diphtheriae bv. gravis]